MPTDYTDFRDNFSVNQKNLYNYIIRRKKFVSLQQKKEIYKLNN